MVRLAKQAEVIQIMHSDAAIFDAVKHLGKRMIVYHTGTRYRENHLHLEQVFKGITSVSDQCEFMHLGDHKYIVSPVELDMAPLCANTHLKIAHYPSHAWTKGTDKIIEMLQPVHGKFEWQHSTALVGHKEQLSRIAKCDIYIELFKPEIRGNPYGCFGVTALEAAAMGKIVITNNLFPKVYTDAYGTCPMTIANTEEHFSNYINQYLKADKNFIRSIQKQNFELMKENHSFTATGNRIIRAIYE